MNLFKRFRGYSTYSVRAHGQQSKSAGFYVAFDGSSCKKTDKKRIFSGKKCGCSSPQIEDRVVVKFFRMLENTEERCDLEIKKILQVDELAKRFRKEHPSCNFQVNVEVPRKAQVEKPSSTAGRWALVEDKLPGDFLQVTDETGRTMISSEDLEKFTHFCYHVTKGELVICGVQGVYQNNNFRLVSPTLHSVSQSYGPFDMGERGVELFFFHHGCSDGCRDWLTPGMSRQEQKQGETTGV